MKKTLFSIVMVLVFALAFIHPIIVAPENIAAHAATENLFIYNWGDYIGPDTIEKFKSWYLGETGNNIRVVYTTYDTNEIMLTSLLKGEEVLDLICPSDYALEKLMRDQKLQKIDKSLISNISNVDPALYDKVDEVFTDILVGENPEDMSDYFVPYMWGTLGVMYNTKYVSKEVAEEAGYGLLWNTPEISSLNKKILIKDSIRDTFVAGVLYLKETDTLPEIYKDLSIQDLLNTFDQELLDAAEAALIDQKRVLKEYEVDVGKGDMVAGRARANLAWSGDALWAIEEASENNIELDYFVPKVGGNVWFDGWAIPSNAQNVFAAHKFIEYMCKPEISIENSLEIGYSSAIDPVVLRENQDVLDAIEEAGYDVDEYFTNIIRYPELTESLGVFMDFGRAQSSALAMWERVKSAPVAGDWVVWVVIASVAVALGLGVLFYFVIKNKKGSKGKMIPVIDNEDVEIDDENEG